MAMSTGAKIALGCALVLVVGGVAVTALVVGGAWWAKGKIEEKAGELKAEVEKVDKLQRQVDAIPFTMPADGVVQEERLVKFLDVRKGMYPIYEAELPQFQKIKGEPQGLEAAKTLAHTAVVLKRLRVALLEGLVREQMSEAEYRFVAAAVYKSAWAAAVESQTGQSMSDAATETAERAAREAEQAAEQANVPEETRKTLRETARQMRERAQQAREQVKQLDAPPANVELFRKHKEEIARYSMTGLETAGF